MIFSKVFVVKINEGIICKEVKLFIGLDADKELKEKSKTGNVNGLKVTIYCSQIKSNVALILFCSCRTVLGQQRPLNKKVLVPY